MRWVNHYTHPGDTRYHVFVFGEQAHADRFEERCAAAEIEVERHEEEGEWMFGVAKTNFKQAMKANHLVHAEFRSHFIPNVTWRWGLLVFTGAVVLLALLGWLTSNAAYGQMESGLPWELDVVSRVHVPSDFFGMGSTTVSDEGLSSEWMPRVGSEFGLRIHRRLREGWTLGGGLEWVRREHLIVVGFNQDSLGISSLDTLPQMRSLAYRLPLLGGVRIPLGWKELELQASGGLGLEWKTSETVVGDVFSTNGSNRIVEAYQGRTRYLSVPVIVELGLQKRASKDKPGWYLGWYWSSSPGQNAWAESTWQQGSLFSSARNWLNQVVTGIDLRLVLPE